MTMSLRILILSCLLYVSSTLTSRLFYPYGYDYDAMLPSGDNEVVHMRLEHGIVRFYDNVMRHVYVSPLGLLL